MVVIGLLEDLKLQRAGEPIDLSDASKGYVGMFFCGDRIKPDPSVQEIISSGRAITNGPCKTEESEELYRVSPNELLGKVKAKSASAAAKLQEVIHRSSPSVECVIFEPGPEVRKPKVQVIAMADTDEDTLHNAVTTQVVYPRIV